MRHRLAYGALLGAVLFFLTAGAALAHPDGPDPTHRPAVALTSAARPTVVTVRPGDTVTALAGRFGDPWIALAAWNRLADPNRIYPGQQLRIPPPHWTPPAGAYTYSTPPQATPTSRPDPGPSIALVDAPTATGGGGSSGWPASCYGITNPDGLWIISRESGCNVYAHNPSGACGIGQRMDSCDGFNGYAQAADMTNYVMGRYGSWAAARAFWEGHSWY